MTKDFFLPHLHSNLQITIFCRTSITNSAFPSKAAFCNHRFCDGGDGFQSYNDGGNRGVWVRSTRPAYWDWTWDELSTNDLRFDSLDVDAKIPIFKYLLRL
ncbi:hypothetical protein L1987_37650 [Smallanthus sonchifolius]|uniref:Uncharacterized protein n=1 Tax=Smallanthus sonchifolius TaxID=185202 RepID=A0ACB9HGX7_9ASTR|nr:hypothetical protein L1987_37650 [Smallanthus sonchifolius]